MGAKPVAGALLTALVAAVAFAPRVDAETRPPYGGDVIASLLGEPVALDPALARTHAEVALLDLVCDGLYRFDAAGEPAPRLAEGEPTVGEDGLTARITVREGIAFHDGAPLTASAVAASLERVRRHRTAGWVLAPVAEISHDGRDVVFALRRPTPELAALLATPAASIVSTARTGARDRLVGTGPFALRLVDRRRRRIVLDAFEDHFAGRTYVDVVELRWYATADGEARAYEAGGTHVSLRGAVAFRGHAPKYATTDVTGPATVLAYVGFGTAHAEILEDAHFRRALSLAMDRESFRLIGTGEPISAAVQAAAPALGGPSPTSAERVANPRAAARELALAQERVSALRAPPVFEIVVDETRPDDVEIGKKVRAALYRLGLNARVTTLSARQFAQRVARGECDLYIGQLAAPGAEPTLGLAAAFVVAGSAWAAEQLAAGPFDLDAALAAFDARLPIIPLFHRGIRAHHRKTLGGVSFDALGRLSLADMFVFSE